MTIRFDLHTHTEYSRNAIKRHARGTVTQNAQAAAAKTIGLGVTDHGPGHGVFGINPKRFAQQRAEIEQANAALGRRVVLQGVEANLMDADGKTDLDLLPFFPEIILMGYHKGVRMNGKAGRRLLVPALFAPKRCSEIMTTAVICALERYPIDVLTHPGEYVPVDMARVAGAAARLGVAIELNNKHPLRRKDIAAALAAGVYFVLSSDAHATHNIGVITGAAWEAEDAKIPKELIINSGEYKFDKGLRLDRLGEWAAELGQFSTGQK